VLRAAKVNPSEGVRTLKFDYRFAMKAAATGAAACLALTLWSASTLAQAPAPPPGGRLFTADRRAQTLTYHLDDANTDVQYCLFKSSKVTKSKPAPLIVALHGFGAGPQIMCNTTAIDLAEKGGYILVAPMGYSIAGWYGSPVIRMRAGRGPRAGSGPSPATDTAAPSNAAGPSDQEIEKWSEEDVMNVLAMMRKEFNIDKNRIYLTGHSMGGAGTYFLASKHADIWAAVAPVAPAAFMMTQKRSDILKGIKDGHVPILVVQGDPDTVVPVANARTWVQTMKDLKMNYKYIELPGIDHGPVITASQQYVYEFFDKHSKQSE
jgi:poly(3-hydroxybutyrate) depolymerase